MRILVLPFELQSQRGDEALDAVLSLALATELVQRVRVRGSIDALLFELYDNEHVVGMHRFDDAALRTLGDTLLDRYEVDALLHARLGLFDDGCTLLIRLLGRSSLTFWSFRDELDSSDVLPALNRAALDFFEAHHVQPSVQELDVLERPATRSLDALLCFHMSELIARDDPRGEQRWSLLRRAALLDPEYEEASLALLALLRSMGRGDDAKALLRDGLRRRPDSPALLLEWARCELEEGEAERAAASLQELCERRPFDLPAQQLLCLALLAAEKEEEARFVLSEALHRFPDDPKLLQIGNVLRASPGADPSGLLHGAHPSDSEAELDLLAMLEQADERARLSRLDRLPDDWPLSDELLLERIRLEVLASRPWRALLWGSQMSLRSQLAELWLSVARTQMLMLDAEQVQAIADTFGGPAGTPELAPMDGDTSRKAELPRARAERIVRPGTDDNYLEALGKQKGRQVRGESLLDAADLPPQHFEALLAWQLELATGTRDRARLGELLERTAAFPALLRLVRFEYELLSEQPEQVLAALQRTEPYFEWLQNRLRFRVAVARQRQRWVEASELMSVVLALDTENVSVLVDLAELRAQMGDFPLALEWLAPLAGVLHRSPPQSQQFRDAWLAFSVLLRLLRGRRELDAALLMVSQQEAGEADWGGQLDAARSYLLVASGDEARLRLALERALQQGPSADAARLLEEVLDEPLGCACFLSVIPAEPVGSAAVRARVARLCVQAGAVELARRWLDAASPEDDEGRRELAMGRGVLAEAEGDLFGAIEHWSTLQEYDSRVELLVGVATLALGVRDLAVQTLGRAFSREPLRALNFEMLRQACLELESGSLRISA
ncbi:MAG: hypothetical protein RBU37_13435 [Myxococcota bacterium]|jgi:predicted Zn-dependent protease|nr:hypothetical protein [Myxococcota bacterium]